jgi:hypothetical protein
MSLPPLRVTLTLAADGRERDCPVGSFGVRANNLDQRVSPGPLCRRHSGAGVSALAFEASVVTFGRGADALGAHRTKTES